MHSTNDCPSGDALLVAGDNYVKLLVTTIMHSKGFTPDSAIVLAWDEDDYSSTLGCCGSLPNNGGGHDPLIVITPNYKNAIESALPSNHYSELRSIEDLLGLGTHLGHSAQAMDTLYPLLP